MLPSEDSGKLQVLLDSLDENAGMFGIFLAHSECKMPLQLCIGSKPYLVLAGDNWAK